ncbi:hypothetical protein L394_01064 [Klebsiella pneumoniae MGH 48]|nr:hypothetical protein L394_01064 [Klebsiella pneumoniae MGH 48]SWC78127.1 DNA N-4 cytosine methyltransferase M.NgoMXV [Klebsiella pneumoniae]
MTEQTILDMCCGSRMFWFDKQDSRAVFMPIEYQDDGSIVYALGGIEGEVLFEEASND